MWKSYNTGSSSIALALLAFAALGCSEDDDVGTPLPSDERVIGETGSLGGGELSVWAELGAVGEVVRAGVSLPLGAISDVSEAESLHLRFPTEVVSETFLSHLGIGYLPGGHGPEAYLAPHFDIHFYGVPPAVQEAIDCVDEPAIAAERIPAPYIIPGTGMEPAGTCVPGMGVHAIDPTSPELDPENPAPFTETFIVGYHDGAMAFIEPMVTREYLLGEQSYSRPVPTPSVLGRSTRWPGTFEQRWDEAAGAYELILSNFGEID